MTVGIWAEAAVMRLWVGRSGIWVIGEEEEEEGEVIVVGMTGGGAEGK